MAASSGPTRTAPRWLLLALVLGVGLARPEEEWDDAAQLQLLDDRWRLAAEPEQPSHPIASVRSLPLPTTRSSGANLLVQLQQAANRGSSRFTIPPGNYYFTSSFELRRARNMLVIAAGVTFWFGVGAGFKLTECTNVRWLAETSRPFAIDYDPPVVAQGVVTRIDPSSVARWVEAEFDPMFPMPNQNMSGNIFTSAKVAKVAFWNPSTRSMRRPSQDAINIYLTYTTSNAGAACMPSTGEGCGTRWRIGLSGRVDIVKGLTRVGDLISLNPRIYPHAIELVHSEDLTFEDTHIYAGTNIGIVENKGDGGNTYRRLKITRRPGSPLLMSVNADGFHSNSASYGATIVDSEIGFTGDDLLNIYSGMGVVVERIDDHTAIFLDRKRSSTGLENGDQMTFYHIKTLDVLGRATLSASPAPYAWSGTDTIWNVLNSPPYSIGFSPLYTFDASHIFLIKFSTPLPSEVLPKWSLGQDFEKSNHYASVTNSWLHDSYSRASLAKTSFFRVENTLYQRASGLYVGTIEVNWLEGDAGFQGAEIVENRFEDCAPDIVDESPNGDTLLSGNVIRASSSYPTFASPPPPLLERGCGLGQPFTKTTTNLYGSGKWCGGLIGPGLSLIHI